MAKRKIIDRTKPNETENVCGDCGWGKWVDTHSNLDMNKNPLCLTCPESEFHILRTEKACKKWKRK